MSRRASAERWLATAVLLLGISAGSACEHPSMIELRLSGLSPGADRVHVTATQLRRAPDTWSVLQTYQPVQRDIGRDSLLDRILFSLPNRDWVGSVELDVRQFTSGDSCTRTRGQTEVAVRAPGDQTVDLALVPTPWACGVNVELIGAKPGSVVRSSPTGLVCPSRCEPGTDCTGPEHCLGFFPAGTAVRLTAVPDQKQDLAFSNWLGVCEGTLDCQLTVAADEGTNLAANFVDKPVCSAGWCWENPHPAGGSLQGVQVVSADEIWVVGERGLVLRWTGSRWQQFGLDESSRLTGVARDAAGRLWTIAESGAIWRREPTGMWRQMARLADSLRAVWLDGKDGVWVSGDRGLIAYLTSDGAVAKSWRPVALPLLSVAGSGPADVWACGESGTLVHWDGAQWRTVSSGTTSRLNALYSQSPSRVFAVGDRGTALSWNGVSWDSLPTGLSGSLRAVWGSGPSSVWVAGADGIILRWDGRSWQREPILGPLGSSGIGLYGLHGAIGAPPWAVGMGGIVLRRDPEGWTALSQGFAQGSLNALWVGGANNVWIVGDDGRVWRWDGRAWQQAPSAGVGLAAVIGFGNDDVWVSGSEGYVARWQRNHWQKLNTGVTDRVSTIWGPAPDNLWAGTAGGQILHWDGLQFSVVKTLPRQWITAIWGSGSTDAWAVGAQGLILHWQGSEWQPEPCNCDPSSFLQDVTGSSQEDVWALSLDGAIVRRRNGVWSPVPSLQKGIKVLKLWVRSYGEAWAVADMGSIVHVRASDELEVKSVGIANSLHAIGGTADGLNIWVAGTQNSILRYRPLSRE